MINISKAILPLSIVWFLSGCAPQAFVDNRPAEHKIASQVSINELFIKIPAPGQPLDTAQYDILRDGIAKASAQRPVSVEVTPPVGSDPKAMGQILKAIADLGVPPHRLRMAPVADSAQIAASVKLITVVLEPPACPGIPRSLIDDDTPLNIKLYPLGCATAANLATSLADPRDLVDPRHTDTTEAARSLRAFEYEATRNRMNATKTDGQKTTTLSN